MKYVKTFENFNYDSTNEGWLWGEGNIWSKIGNWISDWKDRKVAEGAEKFKNWAEKNPEKIAEIQDKVKPEFDKLSDEQQQELINKLESYKGETPPADVVEAAEEVVKVEEKLKKYKKGTKLYESNSLILENTELSLGRKILYWLGIGMIYLGVIVAAISAIIAVGGTLLMAAGAIAVSSTILGLSGAQIAGILVAGVVTIFSGVIIQYNANPKHPDNRYSNAKTGWESSGGPIM